MKILHINTNSKGGAAQAAIRIHLAQLESGIDSHILFLKENPEDLRNAYSLQDFMPSYKLFLLDKLNRALNYRYQLGKPKCFFNSPHSLFRLDKLSFLNDFDLINLHWVVKFIDYPTFFKNIKKPFVWTMHDMNPFSGGMHYKTGFSEKHYSLLEDNFRKKKKKSLENSIIAAVGPSVWITEESKQTNVFPEGTHFKTIRNTIDINLFKPDFDLKSEHKKPLILFVAEDSSDKRKGMKYLIEAINYLNPNEADIVVIGKKDPIWPAFIQQIGYVSSQSEMIKWYNKATLFVIPSIEDNLPNTILESLSCGTPVVGFNSGGIKDIIEHKKTGFIAPNRDSQELANGITYVLSENKNNSMSKFARSYAEKTFESSLIANEYKELYSQLLSI